jgi:hypothetical protein
LSASLLVHAFDAAYSRRVVIQPRVAPYLPDDIWKALLAIKTHIDTLPADDPSRSGLVESVETLAIKLAEASKAHGLRYPIGG